MNLLEIIQLKYPDAVNLVDYEVSQREDGKLIISRWHLPDPKPTKEDIAIWKEEASLQQQYERKTIREQRKIAYPSIQEQLDMMYHDKVEGTTLWVDTIAAVKSEFPLAVEAEAVVK
jgi:hypothetical protein